ncbi:MAG: winged helix-turn-helix domain-containing protein [Acidimicrobiales bacterium]
MTAEPTAPGEGEEHPVLRLEDTIHQRTRLGILAILSETTRADFAYLRGALGLTDGNLSRHLSVLDEAGLVTVTKVFEGRRPRTWIRATKKGTAALERELHALRDLLDRLDRT